MFKDIKTCQLSFRTPSILCISLFTCVGEHYCTMCKVIQSLCDSRGSCVISDKLCHVWICDQTVENNVGITKKKKMVLLHHFHPFLFELSWACLCYRSENQWSSCLFVFRNSPNSIYLFSQQNCTGSILYKLTRCAWWLMWCSYDTSLFGPLLADCVF